MRTAGCPVSAVTGPAARLVIGTGRHGPSACADHRAGRPAEGDREGRSTSTVGCRRS
ncbi:hypothetical protein [Kitasatospora purpeofusca]|uniref:Uncharacterized protein n=1 Tax=Kitasatospora purpeofusca TaxID=67352 RepID=A0ABZ1UDS5_9ACTN|nr:hypothetical protein [Kitasatospora purpeofusca]